MEALRLRAAGMSRRSCGQKLRLAHTPAPGGVASWARDIDTRIWLPHHCQSSWSLGLTVDPHHPGHPLPSPLPSPPCSLWAYVAWLPLAPPSAGGRRATDVTAASGASQNGRRSGASPSADPEDPLGSPFVAVT